MTPKIRLQNISKRFAVGSNVVPAVENVNLSLNSGDFVTLVGPSGLPVP